MENQNKSIVGTQTEKNLVIAYMSESAAYSRYIFYAKQATKENLFPVAEIFNQTADNELHHAKVFFKFLQGGKVEVPICPDAGVIADTASNLRTAIEEERTEGVDMYRSAAKTAREEGFDEIADHFDAIADVEEHHRLRFERYLNMVVAGTLWHRDKPVVWRCLVCGYQMVGTEPPMSCPGCDHPYQHYIAIEDDF